MDRLQSSIPQADFQSVEQQICDQFAVGILDGDTSLPGEHSSPSGSQAGDLCQDCNSHMLKRTVRAIVTGI